MIKILRRLIAIVAILGISASVHAQVDTSFWFAIPKTGINGGAYPGSSNICVVALDQDAIVTISLPTNQSAFESAASAANVPLTVTVPANTSYTFKLATTAALQNIVVNANTDTVTNTGILLSAGNRILAYYETVNVNNIDLYALKGNNALGTDFIITGLKETTYAIGAFGSNILSSFHILATQNGTTITITPSVVIAGHAAGTPYSVTLNRGQVYTGVATNNYQQVGGTLVTSNNPIAITTNNDIVQPSSYNASNNTEGALIIHGDVAGDQEVPISQAGTNFITVPGLLNAGGETNQTDNVYVYSTVAGTTNITVNGVAQTITGKGSNIKMRSSGPNVITSLDNPVLVFQLSGSGGEVGGATIPQLNCTGSQKVGIIRSISGSFYINLVVKAGYENGFLFNGSNTIIQPSAFVNVPGISGWKYAQVSIPTSVLAVGNQAIITNNFPFHLGVINTTGLGCEYGYFSNFSKVQPEVVATNNYQVCSVTGVTSTLSTALIGNAYQWKKNGIVIAGATSPSYTTSTKGEFTVDVTASDVSCGIATSAPVTITDPCLITISGTIFNDKNALTNNTVDGNGTDSLTNSALYVYYLDASNAVKNIYTVNADGTYSFDIEANASCKIAIGTNVVTVGTLNPSITIPYNWMYTGEFVGTGNGNDGNINGQINITATSTDIPEANFGVRLIPPVITAPANNDSTNNNTPPITGTAVPGAIVNVIIDGNVVGTAIADSIGNWTFTPTTPLTDGSHTVSATVTDAVGNTSEPSVSRDFIVYTIPLAISVVDFTGKTAMGGSNILTWIVADENGIKEYTVLRSNNKKIWDAVGSVNATNKKGIQKFSLVDANPNDINFYRLQITATNGGTSNYQKIVYLKMPNGTKEHASIYSNPAYASLNFVYMSSVSNAKIDIAIMDAMGKKVLVGHHPLILGENKINIDLKGLAEGTYYLVYNNTTTNTQGSLKFVKKTH